MTITMHCYHGDKSTSPSACAAMLTDVFCFTRPRCSAMSTLLLPKLRPIKESMFISGGSCRGRREDAVASRQHAH